MCRGPQRACPFRSYKRRSSKRFLPCKGAHFPPKFDTMTMIALAYSEGWLLTMCVSDQYFLEHLLQNILKFLTYVEFCRRDAIHFEVSFFLLNLICPSLPFIEPCLRRPTFNKETLKGSQPHLFQTIIEFHPNFDHT